jgi:acyl-CoA thioester hydrolase
MDKREQAPVFVEIPIAWGEMDALGHVNNIVYFRYFETARIEYLRRIGWSNVNPVGGIGVILHSVQARFRVPLTFPDSLRVTSRLVRLEADRLTLGHDIRSERLGVLAAEGSGIIVAYDYARATKAMIPHEIVGKIERLEGRSLTIYPPPPSSSPSPRPVQPHDHF